MKKFLFLLGLLMLPTVVVPSRANAVNTIVVSPGHGGYDTGIRAGIVKEKELALSISLKVVRMLKELDKTSYLTRKIDQYLSIEDRISRANKAKPDIFISLHMSGTEDFAVYVTSYRKKVSELTLKQYYSLFSKQRKYLYQSNLLAGIMEDVIAKEFGIKVYHREMPLPVLSSIGAPAVLIEVPSVGLDYEEESLHVASCIVLGVLIYEEWQ